MLFASLFFFLGAIDEFAVDGLWLWLKLRGRVETFRLEPTSEASEPPKPLKGKAAILVPAWQEATVIGATIAHALKVWGHADWTLYVGCYRNDPPTIMAVIDAAAGDARVKLVIHDAAGPTTKADCLNRLYRAVEDDEMRQGEPWRMILLQDAEDMVDPAALALLDAAMDHADFAQLPVLPEALDRSRWIASHYCEEFAEAHGKSMVVRDALGAGLPSAGVGCAISRSQLARLAAERSDGSPFDPESLTEDYQLGLAIGRMGGRMRFLRVRHSDGRLVATRACFPDRIDAAVRQKTRWLHGIAFQGWDRLGWSRSPVESWMRLRDRRGPFAALVLAIAYVLVVLSGFSLALSVAGLGPKMTLSPLLWWLVVLNLASLVWRALFRFAFTAREYGLVEGLRAILRIPFANVIAIMAGRRAFVAYLRCLAGKRPRWDKTDHHLHPAQPGLAGVAA
ncbi:glycosyl transferase family protein [Erythrobacter sp. SDW2]|nr:glycosyl transferase family protein [Erythrobacter sp. SDW2]UIP08236.1 glycosyl transferase family protein [Erythrobacter sp. SDW2]